MKFSVTGTALSGAVVALYAGGVLLGYPALVSLALGGLALLVTAVALVLLRPRVTVTRTIEPARVTAGEPVLGRLEVRNPSRWPAVGFTAVDRVGRVEVPVPVGALAPSGSTVVGYAIPVQRRGRIPLGPLTVTRRDPLGLVSLARPVATGSTILWSYPRTHPVRPLPIGVVLDYEGTTMAHATAGSTTFAALREYVAGDDPRHINWRATARTGTLIVREHVDTAEPTTAVVLDARVEALDPDAFEEAVEACASVCRSVESYGRPVDLFVVGENRADLIGLGVRTLLDRLAVVSRTTTDDDPVRLFDTVGRIPGGGALVVVTGNREPAVVTRLAEQRRRFNPLVVVSLLGDADPGDTGIRRQAGTTVLRARTGVDAAATWNRMVGGE